MLQRIHLSCLYSFMYWKHKTNTFCNLFFHFVFEHFCFICLFRSGWPFLTGGTSYWWWACSPYTLDSFIMTVSPNPSTSLAQPGASRLCSQNRSGRKTKFTYLIKKIEGWTQVFQIYVNVIWLCYFWVTFRLPFCLHLFGVYYTYILIHIMK